MVGKDFFALENGGGGRELKEAFLQARNGGVYGSEFEGWETFSTSQRLTGWFSGKFCQFPKRKVRR